MEDTGPIVRGAVIGGGAFGTALACVLSSKGALVKVWVRSESQKLQVETTRENANYLPGFRLPDRVHFSNDIHECVLDVDIVILAIPTQYLRAFLVRNRSTLPVGVPIVACAKGIELETLQFPYDILMDELPGKYTKHLAVLSGPSFAKEVIAKQPTSVTVSSNNPETASLTQVLVSSREYNFRVYTSDDIIGCEVAGAVKNVLAIAAGAAGGLGFGNNTRAMLVCRGLAELCRLATKLKSTGKCLSGLAGVGDLMLTCSSEMSRNYSVGRRLAQGETIQQIISSTQSVAEGIATAEALHALALKHNVEMPICNEVYQVLYQHKTVTEALLDLTQRPLSAE